MIAIKDGEYTATIYKLVRFAAVGYKLVLDVAVSIQANWR